MSYRSLVLLPVLVAFAAVSAPLYAQDSKAADSSPATASQTSSTAPGQQASKTDASNSSAQPTEKKVWTNDDVNGLHGDSAISTFSPPETKTTNAGATNSAPGHKGAQWYKTQITKLQAKIPPLNERIAQLQAALDGKSPGDGEKSTRPIRAHGGQFADDMERLEQQRDNLQKQIEALRDQARHSGVPAKDLP